jgi:hypothetical protein
MAGRRAEQQMRDGGRPAPTANAATIPMGRVVPRAIPAAAPMPSTHRPAYRNGRAMYGEAVTTTAVASAQPHRQVHAGRAGRAERPEALRPVGPGEPPGDQRHPDRQRPGQRLLPPGRSNQPPTPGA